jgi:hypothetical protein
MTLQLTLWGFPPMFAYLIPQNMILFATDPIVYEGDSLILKSSDDIAIDLTVCLVFPQY